MRYFLLQKYGQTCIDIPVLKFFLRLHGECDNNLALCMETPRKFIIARLSIRKLGSSSVLIIWCIISTDEDPSLRSKSFAIISLRGVSTKLNKYIVFTMQTHKKLITVTVVFHRG